MKIALMGLEFALENMGCQALAYSFANIIDDVSRENDEKNELIALVFRKFEPFTISESTSVSCIQIKYKSVNFWKQIWNYFRQSDLIVDFTGGDSFSDIYGLKRFLLASNVKYVAIKSGTPLMLGPQTYGPYKHSISKAIARYILKRSRWVFARDEVSANLASTLGKRNVDNTTDVAFSLPYIRRELNDNKTKVGINISGLLWNGGYSFAKLPIQVEYQKYVFAVLDYLCSNDKFSVYLIPHVGFENEKGLENDYYVSEELLSKYPSTKLVRGITTPMEAKGYISAMDIFIGARMHATIASLSSGVVTIPFSYSRKFEGLFDNLGYPYVISAQTTDTSTAIQKTIEWIEKYQIISLDVEKAHQKIELLHNDFVSKFVTIMADVQNDTDSTFMK